MRWKLGATALGLLAMSTVSSPSFAADHRDGTVITADPSADVNDVFSWMSADGSKVYFAMTVFPAATAASKFSNAVQYVFNISSGATLGAATSTIKLMCTFDTAQKASCWLGKPGAAPAEYLTGDASVTTGIASASGKLKVFAGLRNDPFFFNLAGFNATAALVKAAAPALIAGNKFDAAGCPTLPAGTAAALVKQLQTAADGSAPKDFFSKLNGLAIVVAVDKGLVTAGGPIMGVYASTHKAQ